MTPMKKKKSIVKKSVVDQMAMTRIPNSDLFEGYRELTSNAFKLLTYYYSKGDGWVFDPKVIAEALGLSSTRTVQTLTKELQTRGYLYCPKGDLDVYIVGKKQVQEYKP